MIGSHALWALQRVLNLRCANEVAQVPLHDDDIERGFNCQWDTVSAVTDDNRAILLLRAERFQSGRVRNANMQLLLGAGNPSAGVHDQVSTVEPVRLAVLVRVASPHIDLQAIRFV